MIANKEIKVGWLHTTNFGTIFYVEGSSKVILDKLVVYIIANGCYGDGDMEPSIVYPRELLSKYTGITPIAKMTGYPTKEKKDLVCGCINKRDTGNEKLDRLMQVCGYDLQKTLDNYCKMEG